MTDLHFIAPLPHPERTPIHLVEYPATFTSRERSWSREDGVMRETTYSRIAVYVCPDLGEDPLLHGEPPGQWQIRRVQLVNGLRDDRLCGRYDSLAEAKVRVDWLAQFCSRRFRGDFADWCVLHRIRFPTR